jgi:hypothetical protein
MMDWIRTMAERLSVEEEDGKLCARKQMSRQTQLTAMHPYLPTHPMLGKASCATLGVFTPPPPPRVAYTINDKGGLYLFNGEGQPTGNS